MGFFDKVVKAVNIINKASEQLENLMENQNATANKPVSTQSAATKPTAVATQSNATKPVTAAQSNVTTPNTAATTQNTVVQNIAAAVESIAVEQPVGTFGNIRLLPSTHIAEAEEFANDDMYTISFEINDSFKETRSHAAEIIMLNTYAPDTEYGEEGSLPYIAIQTDDAVYTPVEEFKKTGTFKGAIEITPLGGKFYFKAKKEYYRDIMYFYGFDRCDGYWENNGLCVVYPKSYMGTESETALMRALDAVAASYSERKCSK